MAFYCVYRAGLIRVIIRIKVYESALMIVITRYNRSEHCSSGNFAGFIDGRKDVQREKTKKALKRGCNILLVYGILFLVAARDCERHSKENNWITKVIQH